MKKGGGREEKERKKRRDGRRKINLTALFMQVEFFIIGLWVHADSVNVQTILKLFLLFVYSFNIQTGYVGRISK